MNFPISATPYVYIFRDSSKLDAAGNPEAIYVGKCDNKRYKGRCFEHLSGINSNKRLTRKLKKMERQGIDYIIEIWDVPEGETAAELEMFLIAFIGRADKGEGTLYNNTDGGEGTSGYRMRKATRISNGKKAAETRKKNGTQSGEFVHGHSFGIKTRFGRGHPPAPATLIECSCTICKKIIRAAWFDMHYQSKHLLVSDAKA